MGSATLLADKLAHNKMLLALVVSVAIVTMLFYSVPAAAFWIGSTTASATQTSGTSSLSVTFQIN